MDRQRDFIERMEELWVVCVVYHQLNGRIWVRDYHDYDGKTIE